MNEDHVLEDVHGQLGDTQAGTDVYFHTITTETAEPKLFIRTEYNEGWGTVMTMVGTAPFVARAGRASMLRETSTADSGFRDPAALRAYHQAKVQEYKEQPPDLPAGA